MEKTGKNQTSWKINTINKGGITRPGYRTCFRLPDGESKGMTSFTNSDGKMCIAMVVDDKTYISEHPFESYKEVTI